MASRRYCVPRNPCTPAQQRMRGAFGGYSQMWGRKLTEAQRQRWNAEGAEVWSHPRCGTRGRLTGEQFFTGINSVLACCDLPPLWEPPARVVFQLSPVRELIIQSDESGVRLFLRLAGAPTEDIMVFGQAPCSAGRSKRRNVSYLGLLPRDEDGLSEITELYTAKFGEPRPGTKVFVVTCQQKNGWKGLEHETSEIVPGLPADRAAQAAGQGIESSEASKLNGLNGGAAVDGAPEAGNATAPGGNSLKGLMHKGCITGAKGTGEPPEGAPEAAGRAGEGGVKGAGGGSGGSSEGAT